MPLIQVISDMTMPAETLHFPQQLYYNNTKLVLKRDTHRDIIGHWSEFGVFFPKNTPNSTPWITYETKNSSSEQAPIFHFLVKNDEWWCWWWILKSFYEVSGCMTGSISGRCFRHVKVVWKEFDSFGMNITPSVRDEVSVTAVVWHGWTYIISVFTMWIPWSSGFWSGVNYCFGTRRARGVRLKLNSPFTWV